MHAFQKLFIISKFEHMFHIIKSFYFAILTKEFTINTDQVTKPIKSVTFPSCKHSANSPLHLLPPHTAMNAQASSDEETTSACRLAWGSWAVISSLYVAVCGNSSQQLHRKILSLVNNLKFCWEILGFVIDDFFCAFSSIYIEIKLHITYNKWKSRAIQINVLSFPLTLMTFQIVARMWQMWCLFIFCIFYTFNTTRSQQTLKISPVMEVEGSFNVLSIQVTRSHSP